MANSSQYGDASLRVQLTGGSGGSRQEFYYLQVNDVPRFALANGSFVQFGERVFMTTNGSSGALVGSLSFTDRDDTNLAVRLQGNHVGMFVVDAAGRLRLRQSVPIGDYDLRIEVSDSRGASAVAQVRVQVRNPAEQIRFRLAGLSAGCE